MTAHPTRPTTDQLEGDAMRDPLTVRTWVHLLGALHTDATSASTTSTAAAVVEGTGRPTSAALIASFNKLHEVYERALMHNPYSYKLWTMYIRSRLQSWVHLTTTTLAATTDAADVDATIAALKPLHRDMNQSIGKLYERALAKLPNMPLLWTDYLLYLMQQGSSGSGVSGRPFHAFNELHKQYVAPTPHEGNEHHSSPLPPLHGIPIPYTKIRVVILRALQALPVTQHTLVWNDFRKFCASQSPEALPMSFIDVLWKLLLLGNTSDKVMAEYMQLLVRSRQHQRLLKFCCSVSEGEDRSMPRPPLPRVFRDPVLWELIEGILMTSPVDPNVVVDVDVLGRLVSGGKSYSLQPDRLTLAFAVYLMRTGSFTTARTLLMDVIENTSNPNTFQDAFAAFVRMEQQLVDCVALDSTASSLSVENLNALVYRLVGEKSSTDDEQRVGNAPLDATRCLTSLIDNHALYLNAVQLRQRPHDPRLWLKRVECIYERASRQGVAYHAPQIVAEVEDVLAKGAARCRAPTRSSSSGDDDPLNTLHPSEATDASSLYTAWAELLVLQKRHQDAITLLQKATFAISFVSVDQNCRMFGLLVEAMCAMQPVTSSHEEEAQDDTVCRRNVLHGIMAIVRTELERYAQWRAERTGVKGAQRVTMAHMFSGHRGSDGGILARVLATQELWTIVWDVIFWAEGPSGACGEEIRQWMCRLRLYTPAVVLVRVAHMRKAGLHVAALHCLDEALSTADWEEGGGSITAYMSLVDTYAACLLDLWTVPSFEGNAGAPLPVRVGTLASNVKAEAVHVERLRSALQRGLSRIKTVASVAPQAALTTILVAASIEESIGLYGNTLRILADGCKHFAPPATNATEEQQQRFINCLESLCTKTLQYRGSVALFTQLSDLLKLPVGPYCTCEITLRLTAELSRARQVDKCRAVFQAVAPRQDPSTPHGITFWGAWATMEREFGTETTFVSAQRTKRNVATTFSKSEVAFDQ